MSERFELPAELNIYSVVETREALLAWIAKHRKSGQDSLQVFARSVAEVDGAGLQLLMALSRAEPNCQLVEPSHTLVEACQGLGLAEWLERHRSTRSGAMP